MAKWKLVHGDAIEEIPKLEKQSVDLVFTSPNPYRFSETGIGSETKLIDYFINLIKLFENVGPILKDFGSIWIHMVDYHNDINGNMMMIPERFAFIMQDKGWVLRDKIVWHRYDEFPRKDNKRFRVDWEPIYHFAKSKASFFNEGSTYRNSSVLESVYIKPKSRHESGFPKEIIQVAIDSTCPIDGTILDPLCDSAITGQMALNWGRDFIGIELQEDKYERAKANLGSITAEIITW